MNYCALARASLLHMLTHHRYLTDTRRVGRRAACFVSLHTPPGDLRGCVGTLEPVRDDLAEEIIYNAVSAGLRDPRFPPVTAAECADLVLEVSVLAPSEPIADARDLDPRRYGVIVTAGSRRGVLLPDLEGIDDAAAQIAIAKRKAEIAPEEPVRLRRFTVEKYHEHPAG